MKQIVVKQDLLTARRAALRPTRGTELVTPGQGMGVNHAVLDEGHHRFPLFPIRLEESLHVVNAVGAITENDAH